MRLRVAKKLMTGRERKHQQARFMFVPVDSYLTAHAIVLRRFGLYGLLKLLERSLTKDGYSPNSDGWWYDPD